MLFVAYVCVFLATQYVYLPWVGRRGITHVLLVQLNTMALFVLTWKFQPLSQAWQLQPLYLLVMPLWADLWFFCTHRVLHLRWFYNRIHHIHHQRSKPEPIDAFYSHPLENAVHNWGVIGIPLLFWPGFSNLSLAICGPAMLFNSLSAHSPSGHRHGAHHLDHSCNLGAGLYLADKYVASFKEQ